MIKPWIGLIVFFFWYPLPSHAFLGETRSVVNSRERFNLHTTEKGGARIREYASASGTVFGIAWDGLTHPDLSEFLGKYDSEYQHAIQNQKRHPGRRFFSLRTPYLIVEKWGWMRHSQGRVFVPTLIPQGVQKNAIR